MASLLLGLPGTGSRVNPVRNATDATEPLAASRRRTLELIEHVPTADLERVLSEPMSPLVWDLAHIASYEDLWLGHRYGGLSLLHPELAEMYDAFETPRAVRAELPLLGTNDALEYLDQVRERLASWTRRAPATPATSSSSPSTSSSTPRRCARRWHSPESCLPGNHRQAVHGPVREGQRVDRHSGRLFSLQGCSPEPDDNESRMR